MSTIVEVAKRAAVSIATVSNVIRGTKRVSPALQKRVQFAIRELDYYPNAIARGLKVKQTRMLGMVLPDITNPFFPGIIRGAEDTRLRAITSWSQRIRMNRSGASAGSYRRYVLTVWMVSC